MQQCAGVFEHHPRLPSLGEQLREELAHPLVTPAEGRSVVIVPDVRMLGHPLEIADDFGRAQIAPARGDQRLMHVQRDRERAVDVREIRRGSAVDGRVRGGRDGLGHQGLGAGEVQLPVDIFRNLSHHLCLISS